MQEQKYSIKQWAKGDKPHEKLLSVKLYQRRSCRAEIMSRKAVEQDAFGIVCHNPAVNKFERKQGWQKNLL